MKVSWFFPVAFFVICSFLVVFPAFETPALVAVDLAILAAGVAVYLVFIAWKNKPKSVRKAFHAIDLSVQKLFLAVPED